MILFYNQCFSLDVIVKNDNGQPRSTGYSERYFWEESKILKPSGPCILKKLQIYFVGSTPNVDTIYISGDPSEGYLPPTFWVIHFNQLTEPIIFNYPGKPGWYEFNVENILIGGLDRVVVQHRLNETGPWFAVDNDGISEPYSSFLMNPFENNSLGGPGNYYIANGDFLVRLLVEYLYPKDSSSAGPFVPTFFDVTKDVGIIDGNGNYIRSSDVSVVDWNNDGLDDIAIGSYFFQNLGNGKFRNVSNQFNITASMTSWGDFDNDGFIDCYALRNGNYDENSKMVYSLDRVYKNNGNGTFTVLNPRQIFKLPYPSPAEDFKVNNPWSQDSIPNPYSCITPLWSDFNNDGRLDLFLANNRVGLNVSGNYVERYFPDQLWFQEQDGKFKNVTKSSGLLNYEIYNPNTSSLGYYDCYGANACDYNNDGLIDIFVANYRLVRDLLLRNNGNGTFTNVGDVTGVQGVPTSATNYFGHGMGCEWGDFNNDGFPDLAVGNLGHPDWRGMYSNPSLIFKNLGPPTFRFQEVHKEMGLKFYEMNAGVTWGDFDLDGYLDIWHGQISYRAEGEGGEPKRPGRIYFNSGPPRYKLLDKTWEVGCIVHGPWNAVRIDFDNDGDLDLLVASSHEGVRLFRNDLERKGNWVGFRLRGNPENRVNMDCYGTKLYLFCGSNKYYRELMGSISGNRCSQNSNAIHFGIGRNEKIDSLIIVYPNGFSRTYRNIPPNRYYLVKYNQDLTKSKISTPQCIYPKNLQFNLPENLTFYWSKVEGAEKYEILVDDNSLFANPKKVLTDKDSALVVGLSKSKLYFWKVRAISSNDTSLWSGTFSFFVGNPIPSKVSLFSPTNKTVKLSLTPRLVWGRPSFSVKWDVEYTFELQVSKDIDFKNIVIAKANLRDTFYIVQPNYLTPGSSYYWRVKAKNVDGQGEWSDVFEFQTNTLPQIIQLTSPENNSINIALKPTFRWQQIDNVEEYIFQLSEKPSFDSLIIERTLQATLYKHINSLKENTKYYWRVCGKNNVGLGPWSDVWNFTTITPSLVCQSNTDLIEVHPNPFEEEFSIICKSPSYFTYRIIDILGRELSNGIIIGNSTRISLSGAKTGTYILELCNSNKKFSILIYKFDFD
ncbi:MAG: FG-GAP-like repeat-containing protein [Ignavibacteria bacterium]|nr:FG-GAP-like repeat-containing protein [Ignavibacteria bacterium]